MCYAYNCNCTTASCCIWRCPILELFSSVATTGAWIWRQHTAAQRWRNASHLTVPKNTIEHRLAHLDCSDWFPDFKIWKDVVKTWKQRAALFKFWSENTSTAIHSKSFKIMSIDWFAVIDLLIHMVYGHFEKIPLITPFFARGIMLPIFQPDACCTSSLGSPFLRSRLRCRRPRCQEPVPSVKKYRKILQGFLRAPCKEWTGSWFKRPLRLEKKKNAVSEIVDTACGPTNCQRFFSTSQSAIKVRSKLNTKWFWRKNNKIKHIY